MEELSVEWVNMCVNIVIGVEQRRGLLNAYIAG